LKLLCRRGLAAWSSICASSRRNSGSASSRPIATASWRVASANSGSSNGVRYKPSSRSSGSRGSPPPAAARAYARDRGSSAPLVAEHRPTNSGCAASLSSDILTMCLMLVRAVRVNRVSPPLGVGRCGALKFSRQHRTILRSSLVVARRWQLVAIARPHMVCSLFNSATAPAWGVYGLRALACCSVCRRFLAQ
jgi:hypothetical protein